MLHVSFQNYELATMHGVNLFKEFMDKKQRRKPEVYTQVCLQMSLVTRKPVFGVSNQVRLKPACAVTETR